MKHTINFFVLLIALLCLAACKPTDHNRERTITYTVSGKTAVTVHLTTEEEWQSLLDRFCDYIESGNSVSFCNSNHNTKSHAAKNAVTFSTSNREEMKRWMARMEDQGMTVTVTYNPSTGTYNGTAYATAPRGDCYTGVLVYYNDFLPSHVMSLQLNADTTLIIDSNGYWYQDGYIELDGIVYYEGDTVTICGELMAEEYEGYSYLLLEVGQPAEPRQPEPLWVDLGLPSGTLWASHNVGATWPEEPGDYFAWGETQPKTFYDWTTYAHCYIDDTTHIGWNYHEHELTKYCSRIPWGHNGYTDDYVVLLPEDDAATVNWGDSARTPTLEEWSELKQYCSFHQETDYTTGLSGDRVTGPNGNSIFLPRAGLFDLSSVEGRNGLYYMTSSLCEDNPCRCYEAPSFNANYRFVGRSVRPVRSSQK